MSVTEEQLIQYFKQHRNIEVSGDTTLFSDGTVDSVGLVEVIGFIEKLAGFEVQQADVTLENFDTISSILGYVNNRTDST